MQTAAAGPAMNAGLLIIFQQRRFGLGVDRTRVGIVTAIIVVCAAAIRFP